VSKEPKFSRDMERVTTSFEITRPLKEVRREITCALYTEIQALNYQKYVDGKFDIIRNVERVVEHSSETPGWG
jgi:hypothetical protein